MRISDWSSDVCSSDLKTGHWIGLDVHDVGDYRIDGQSRLLEPDMVFTIEPGLYISPDDKSVAAKWRGRSEEHTSELQSLMRISYAVFCLTKKTNTLDNLIYHFIITNHIIITSTNNHK